MEISWNFVSPKKWEPWSISSDLYFRNYLLNVKLFLHYCC